MPRRNHVREKFICAPHARGQLAKKREAGVDEYSLSVTFIKNRAFARRLARVVESERRLIGRVGAGSKVKSALLNPIVEVLRLDFVGMVKDRVVGNQEFRRGILLG